MGAATHPSSPFGRRWAQVVVECLRYGIVPCGSHPRLKTYPQGGAGLVETDLWVFERASIPSALPQPLHGH